MWVGGHLQVGWHAARLAGLGRRDRALVAVAGALPDLDAVSLAGGIDAYYAGHHVWLHNVFGCAAFAAGAAALGERRARVLLLAALAAALHLVSDSLGLLPLQPFWPASGRPWMLSGTSWTVAALGEIAVPVALIAWEIGVFRRTGLTTAEMLPARARAWLARRWQEHRAYRRGRIAR